MTPCTVLIKGLKEKNSENDHLELVSPANRTTEIEILKRSWELTFQMRPRISMGGPVRPSVCQGLRSTKKNTTTTTSTTTRERMIFPTGTCLLFFRFIHVLEDVLS